MCIPHFLYPFFHWWAFRLPDLLAVMNNAAVTQGRKDLFEILFPTFLDLYPEVGLLDRIYAKSVFNFLRNLPFVFYSGYTSLHSYSVRAFRFLHILANTCYFLFLYFLFSLFPPSFLPSSFRAAVLVIPRSLLLVLFTSGIHMTPHEHFTTL